MGRRSAAAAVLGAILIAGLVVHFALPDTTATDVAGDLLYAGAVYVAIVVIAPRLRPAVVGATALAWGVLIEVFQLTGIPLQIGAAFPPAVLVLGTVFDPRDLVIAVLVPLALTILDSVVAARRGSPRLDE